MQDTETPSSSPRRSIRALDASRRTSLSLVADGLSLYDGYGPGQHTRNRKIDEKAEYSVIHRPEARAIEPRTPISCPQLLILGAPPMHDPDASPLSPPQSIKALLDASTSVSLTDVCFYNLSSVPDHTKNTTDEKADYSIFHQPDLGTFEPIPCGKPRTPQQEAALNAVVQASLRYLFDTHDACSSPCQSQLFGQTPWESDSSHDDGRDTKEHRPKRQRLLSADEEYSTMRFKAHQTRAWDQNIKDLLSFRAREGHCSVPHSYPENPALARWVKRQRYQHNLRAEGKKTSTMTASRVKVLEDIGFIWDSRLAVWEERLCDLRKYCSQHGNCEVPAHYQGNQKLATWVKCQRRQYKLYLAGKPSTMNAERVGILDKLGFSWDVQSFKKNRFSVP
ncbi:unnamed protein product [Cylindrotheca closterium]|uniref:Helicase-associated domain-containing protein n=1 Tax=Cylindrotheca closterium TaxID=2856 RepID=A0AAD2FXR5_9STRA|nr:unnamed protein product [Cylindrotheca closterium]